MKRVLPLLALAALLAYPLHAQEGTAPQVLSTTTGTSSTSTDPKPAHPGRPGRLTPEEMQELHAAHDAALKANPDLAAEDKELRDKMHAHEKKVDDAMIKADPKVAPLIEKIEKERMHHHPGMDGPPPAPEDGNN
jgi:hypothetical protein